MHIACCFSSISIHTVTPDDFSLGTIIPIPKGKNASVSILDNYCSINVGSVFDRMFNNIVLNPCNLMLTSSELEYGFKVIVQEALSYYTHHNSYVYGVFIDASKAFDKVRYTKLFFLIFKEAFHHILSLSALC
jgi:hypothetical protein